MIDSSNSDVVHYSYDSWGKKVSATDTSDASISTLNPFRYRGYIYDPETELYYLGSRYYDAKLGRFINTDNVSNLDLNYNLGSFNLFAYCGNNPVNRLDPYGTDWRTVFTIGLTVAIIGLAVLASLPFIGPVLPAIGASAVASTAASTSVTELAVITVSVGLTAATESLLFAASKK